ncbi:MarR family winged helix-turn-helix transcriptional regulator [Pseudonocardia endophytica]|uniref:DNA-binding MarR family transcriptional regulator n=1 Tax=Pseudonocardia endophytica TaxID=401976 RepID=A0A4R1HP89_PSEEN|nr:DNA-binding MarR family transcriptional regulator [Pseudonocardia endophytica]
MPEPSTLYLVKRLELAIRKVLDDVLRPHGLTAPQYTALTALAQRDDAGADGLTSAQLARRSFVTPQTMHEQVIALERAGLVAREPDPSNRRLLRIRLTGAGRNRMRECADVVADLEGRVDTALGPDERDGVRDALGRALAAVEPMARG